MNDIKYIDEYTKTPWEGGYKKYLPYPHPQRVNPWGIEPTPDPINKELERKIEELREKNHVLVRENHDLMITHCDLQCKIGTLKKTLDKAKSAVKKATKMIAKLKMRIGTLQKFTRFDAMIIEEE